MRDLSMNKLHALCRVFTETFAKNEQQEGKS